MSKEYDIGEVNINIRPEPKSDDTDNYEIDAIPHKSRRKTRQTKPAIVGDEPVVINLNEVMNRKLFINVSDFINQAGNGFRDNVTTLFNYLDVIGFWKDEQTNKSNLARIYDASHTFFASWLGTIYFYLFFQKKPFRPTHIR